MDYREKKKLIRDNSSYTKKDDYIIPILVTENKYTDEGQKYVHQTRYTSEEKLKDLPLINCVRCNKLMENGVYWHDETHQACFACYRELLLEQIVGKYK